MSKQAVVIPIVIDTNVLVPSLYRKTNIFEFILKGNLALIWNDFIYDEAKEIIERMYPIYRKKIPVCYFEIIELLDLIYDKDYKVPEMPLNWPFTSPDRDDDPFLYAAEKGTAKYIISDDRRHMLSVKHHKDIPIGRPKDFFPWVIQNFPL